MLEEVKRRLSSQDISLLVSEKAKEILASLGYDPHYGARPLKRVIEKRILNELAKQLMAGEVKEGQTVKVEERKGELVIR